MVEFSGQLTEKAKNFFYKKTVNIAILEMLVGSSIGAIATIIAWYLIFSSFEFHGVLVGICVLVLLSLLPCTMVFSKKIIPKKITVKGNSISSQTGFRTKTISIKDVKRVCDYGDYYYIVANFLNHSSLFVCQKDLLTKGTIEEFESLFEGKIIKAE